MGYLAIHLPATVKWDNWPYICLQQLNGIFGNMSACNSQMGHMALHLPATVKCDSWHYICMQQSNVTVGTMSARNGQIGHSSSMLDCNRQLEHFATMPGSDCKMGKLVLYPTLRSDGTYGTTTACDRPMTHSAATLHRLDPLQFQWPSQDLKLRSI